MRHSLASALKQLCALLLSECIAVTTVPMPALAADAAANAGSAASSSQPASPVAHSISLPPPAASASLKISPELTPSAGTPRIRNAAASIKTEKASSGDIDRKSRTSSPEKQTLKPLRPSGQIANIGAIGSGFIENKGQWDQRVQFQLKAGGKILWLTDNGVTFDNLRPKPDSQASKPRATVPGVKGVPTADKFERFVFAENFVGAHAAPAIEPTGVQPGEYNYFVGNDPTKWHTNVKAFSGVVYHDAWDGVDVKVASNGRDIEQEFVVHPGADLGQVQVSYNGIDGLEVAKDGSLVVHTGHGDLRETAPRIYQEIAGKRVAVAGRFSLTNKTSYTFKVEPSNPQYALVIDPTLLYSTFLGGSVGYGCGPFSCATGESARGIAVDASGNAYVTGFTQSVDFPTTVGAYQVSSTGSSAFVTKLNPLGTQLVYSTYLGTAFGTTSFGIAVDAAQESYVTGNTGAGFPTSANAYQQACSSSGTFFLTKISAAGNALLYSTCFGLSYFSDAFAIAVDSSGKAYVVGNDTTGALPTTPGAYQPQYAGASAYGGDAFLSVFDPSVSGSASLVYSTYLGGSSDDLAYGVAVDAFGMAYVTGSTQSQNFPITAGAFQSTYPGAVQDVFVAKLNPSASGAASLIYSTYLGGNGIGPGSGSSGQDLGFGIAVDALGQAHVTGATGSANFPVTAGAFQTTQRWHSGFVTTLNAAGNGVVQSTFLGGSSGDQNYASAIALDSLGDAYVTGTTGSLDFPTTPNAFQLSLAGPLNAFVTELNPTGTALVYSSYLGGSKLDQGYGIAVDAVGDAYVTGYTESFDFPVTSFASQLTLNPSGASGPADAFMTKLPLGSPAGLSVAGVIPDIGGNTGTVTVSIIGSGFRDGAAATLSCPGQSNIVATNVIASTGGRSLNGQFSLTGTNSGACNLVIENPDGTSVTQLQAFSIQQGGSVVMWMDIVGPALMRAGGSQDFYLVYGNTGNVDAGQVVVSIELPPVLTLQLNSQAPLIVRPENSGNTFVAYAVADVPPQSSGVVVVSVTAPPLGTDITMPFELNGSLNWLNPQ